MIQIDVYKMLQTADGELPLDISLAIKKVSLFLFMEILEQEKQQYLEFYQGLQKQKKLT